jgi:hypothetical protein
VAVLTAKPLTARPLIARPLTARAIGESALAFAIRDLFANGELGAFIDYTDRSTLFENSDGTTAVASVGDPIGYARDKSGNNNHATQSTDPARPWLGRRPAGGVRNLLANTVDLGSASWEANASGTASGSIITTSASANSGRRSDIELDTTGVSLTVSAKLKEVSGNANWRVSIQEFNGAAFVSAATSAYVAISESGTSMTVTLTGLGGTEFRVVVQSQQASAGNQADVLEVQAEIGSTATPYQRVAAPYDITEAGVASRFYAWDDEVDDDMTIVLPDLGTDATRVTVDRDGNVTYLENQTISGSVSVPLNSQAVIYIDRDLTADEKAGIEGLY